MMKATGLALLLPVRPRLGSRGSLIGRDDRGGATERVVFRRAVAVSVAVATVFLHGGEIPARLGANVTQPMVISDTALPNSFSIHVLANPAQSPLMRLRPPTVVRGRRGCPDRARRLCIACGQHRQAVVDRRVPLVAKPGPVAVVDHPPVAAKVARPASIRASSARPGQGLGDGLLHFIDVHSCTPRPAVLLGVVRR